MQARRWWRALMVMLCCTASGAACAAAEQAEALQDALRVFLSFWAGPPDPEVRVAPAGDLYNVSVSLGAGAATATARQTPGGAWAIDRILLPSPASFTLAAPPGGAGTSAAARVTIETAGQDARAVFDPGRTSASSILGTYRDVRVAVTAPGRHSMSRFQRLTVSIDESPAADATASVAFSGYDGEALSDPGPPVHVALRQADLRLKLTSLAGVFPIGPPGTDRSHRLVLALIDLLTGSALSETAYDLRVDAADRAFGADRVSVSLTSSAPAGVLGVRMELAVAGLSVPVASGGDLVPRNVSVAPVLSGVSMEDVRRLAMAAAAPDRAWPDILVQLLALISRGGIGIGLEGIAFDAGPARIAGSVHVTVDGLTRNNGAGQITATGFDALLARMRQVPAAAEWLHLMTSLRAVAHRTGDALSWDLSLKDSRLMVNGTDAATSAR